MGRDGMGWDGKGQGWPRALRCPNTQAQRDVPRAAPSVSNCQNLALFFTCLFRVISHSALKCRPRHVPIYFLAFYISPCFGNSQRSPSPVPHSPAAGGQHPHPALPGRSASLQPAPDGRTDRRQGKGRTSNPFPSPPASFSLFPPNPRQWFVLLQFEGTHL